MNKVLFIIGFTFSMLMITGAGAETASGSPSTENGCGENCSWTLSADGVLTISGSGAMYGYDDVNDIPWYSKRDSITSIKIFY